MSGPVHNGEDGRLRLQAAGQDDLEVLSALLQDAIIPGEDMFHDQGGRRFVMVVNRFCWDQPPVRGVTSEDGGPVYQRRLCGVQIRGVRAVRQSGMPSDRKSALFNLLAMRADDLLAMRADDAGTKDCERIELLFSGGAVLQFDLDGLSVIAEDIETGQPTPNRPAHDVES